MFKGKKKNILIFVIGLLSMVKLRVIGTFSVGEIVSMATTVFISWRSFIDNKRVVHLFQLSILWLLGVIISDFWNETPSVDALKGVFNVVFLILLIPFTYWIVSDNPQRWMYFYLGVAISSLYNFYFQKSLDIETEFDFQVWMVYAYYPLAIAIAGFLYYYEKHTLAYIVIIGFGVWSLYNSSRNIFLCQSLSVVILLFMDRIRKNSDMDVWCNVYVTKFRQLVLMLMVGLVLVDFVYETLASDGTLGERVYEKYRNQKESKDGLLSARGDAIISLYAISRNPILGYGSYAKDKDGIVREYKLKRQINDLNSKYNLIPGHSYILGAWVYSGILGFLFFAYILRFLYITIRDGWLVKYEKFSGIVMFFMMYTIWNILFSPFGDRILFLFFVIALMVAEQQTENYE